MENKLLKLKPSYGWISPTSTGFNQEIPITTEETPQFPPTAHPNPAQTPAVTELRISPSLKASGRCP